MPVTSSVPSYVPYLFGPGDTAYYQALNTDLTSLGSRLGVSVTDFGADPTGAADSTAAIQKAINSLTSGGVVMFPPGKYTVSSTINISSQTIHLVGAGKNISFILSTNATSDVIAFNGTTFDSSIRSMTIVGPGDTVATNGAGVSTANGVGAILLFDMRIESTWTGILIGNGTNSITGTVMVLRVDLSTFGNDGVFVNGVSQVFLTDITATQVGHAGGAGFHFWSGGGFYLNKCTAGGFQNGLRIDPPNGFNIFDIFLNIFEADSSVGPGMVFDSSNGGVIRGITATNIRSGFSNPGDGILFVGSTTSNVSLMDYFCERNIGNGVSITNLNNSTISGGQVIGNGGAGIVLNSGTGLIVTDNNVGTDTGGGFIQRFGIWVVSTFSQTAIIANNNMYSNTTNLAIASSSPGLIIANNIS